mmetsp:Transcript_44241/g.138681  ORF Transcript_44241/g.138681 Transcript_44241/m.138681 type:complete len:207 (+) Transcript_44241:60-680(+)
MAQRIPPHSGGEQLLRLLPLLLPAAGAVQIQEARPHREVAPVWSIASAEPFSAPPVALNESLAAEAMGGVSAGWSPQERAAASTVMLRQSTAFKSPKVIVLPEDDHTASSVNLARSVADAKDAHSQPAAWSLRYWESTMSTCRYIFGFPKFAWALLCDVLSLTLVLLCIPLLLTCSRRRPPGAPLFDCSFGGAEPAAPKQAPWMTK